MLLSLAQDLPAVWNAPSTDMRLKQRIVRILIREIVVDVDEEKHEVVMLSTGPEVVTRSCGSRRTLAAGTAGARAWKRWKWCGGWPANSATSRLLPR